MGLELAMISAHMARTFSDGYVAAGLIAQDLAKGDHALIASVLHGVETRFILPELSEPEPFVDVIRHSAILAKRWLWWAGDARRAAAMARTILDHPVPKRQSVLDSLQRLAQIMGDSDLLARVQGIRK
jgi:hypothetical protein